jgi:hypothetical protein
MGARRLLRTCLRGTKRALIRLAADASPARAEITNVTTDQGPDEAFKVPSRPSSQNRFAADTDARTPGSDLSAPFETHGGVCGYTDEAGVRHPLF